MTPRWRNAALTMAVLGFIAVMITSRGGNLIGAVINAAIWFGIVYVVYRAYRGTRRPSG